MVSFGYFIVLLWRNGQLIEFRLGNFAGLLFSRRLGSHPGIVVGMETVALIQRVQCDRIIHVTGKMLKSPAIFFFQY